MKKSLLGAGLEAPRTEPLTRVWEGSRLFSLFLDIAWMVATTGRCQAHANNYVETVGAEATSLLEVAYQFVVGVNNSYTVRRK